MDHGDSRSKLEQCESSSPTLERETGEMWRAAVFESTANELNPTKGMGNFKSTTRVLESGVDLTSAGQQMCINNVGHCPHV